MLWFALAIPVLVTTWLLIYHRKETKVWEVAVLFASCLLTIFICRYAVEKFAISDIEYWGNLGQRAVYYEDWNELVIRTETYSCGTSKNPKTCTRTVTDIDYHPEYYELHTDGGQRIRISRAKYKQLVKLWGKPTFKDLHRNYHTDDGDMYYIDWDGEKSTAEPVITVHRYPNRTQVSSSVYKYEKVSEDDIATYKLYDYPELYGYQDNAILGFHDINATKEFLFLNGYWGPKKKVRLWVLVFRNQPLRAGKLQEAYWGGANKNEFVYAIGIDNENKIKWSHVFSWTDVHDLKIEARDFIKNMDTLNLVSLAEWTHINIPRFIKKDFREFDHLKVEPPLWAIIVAYTIILVINILVAIWVVKNEYTDGFRRRRRRF